MYCLLEVVSVYPEKLASRFVDKIDWIKVSFVFSYISIYLLNSDNFGPSLTFSELSSGCTKVVCISQLSVFQSLMNTNKEDMRELAAQLYALVICTMTGNELQLAVRNLIKISKDNHVNSSRLQYIFNFSISFSKIKYKYFFVLVTSRALRRSTAPSWLWATWWGGT